MPIGALRTMCRVPGISVFWLKSNHVTSPQKRNRTQLPPPMMMTIRVTQEIVQGSGRASSMKDTCDHRLLRHVPSPFQPRGTFRNGIGAPWIMTIPQNHSGMRISRHFSLTRPAKFPGSRTLFPPIRKRRMLGRQLNLHGRHTTAGL
jgi:hypothetical protein